MRAAISIVVILAIAAVLALDGTGMYAAHRTAVEVAKGAAEQAAQVVCRHRRQRGGGASDVGGRDRSTRRTSSLSRPTISRATTRWYEVTVRAEPRSYVLKHLPYLKDHLAQQSTAVVHF